MAGLISFGKNLIKIVPKAPLDYIFLSVLCLILYQLTCYIQFYFLIWLFVFVLSTIHEVTDLY